MSFPLHHEPIPFVNSEILFPYSTVSANLKFQHKERSEERFRLFSEE